MIISTELACAFLLQENIVELNPFKLQYLKHYWSDTGFKGTVVNPSLPSLHGGSLETTFTVPLMVHENNKKQWSMKLFKYPE